MVWLFQKQVESFSNAKIYSVGFDYRVQVVVQSETQNTAVFFPKYLIHCIISCSFKPELGYLIVTS